MQYLGGAIDSPRQTGQRPGLPILPFFRLSKENPHLRQTAGTTVSCRELPWSDRRICSRCCRTSFSACPLATERSRRSISRPVKRSTSSCLAVSCLGLGMGGRFSPMGHLFKKISGRRRQPGAEPSRPRFLRGWRGFPDVRPCYPKGAGRSSDLFMVAKPSR